MADLDIFTWQPDYGAQADVTPTVLTAQFGDGYSQDLPLGINSMPQVWTLKFNRDPNAADTDPGGNADDIYNFLINQGGYQRFWWTPPRQEDAIKVKTTGKISKTETDAGQTTISCTFQQVFDPD
jgi:phage-related protein